MFGGLIVLRVDVFVCPILVCFWWLLLLLVLWIGFRRMCFGVALGTCLWLMLLFDLVWVLCGCVICLFRFALPIWVCFYLWCLLLGASY